MSKRTGDPQGSPLQGIRVLDLSRFIAGPYCSMMLGDMGAEVLKIEPPGIGELARGGSPAIGGSSIYTFVVNRNKKSLAIDLRSDGGKAVLRDLIRTADILVENFRPGIMEEMGFGWGVVHALNPRLIMARISGFGQEGPLARKQCFDGVAQAMSGLMSLNGHPDGPPTMIGTFLCDYTTGMYAALGILSSLNARHVTGRGQVVDVALLDSATSLLMTAIPEHLKFQNTMTRRGSRDRYAAPSNTFEAKDGRHVLIVAGDDRMFNRLVRAMKRPDLLEHPQFQDAESRREHTEEIEQVVANWMGGHESADIVVMLEAEEVPCARIATIEEMVKNEQLYHRGQIVEIPYAGERIPVQGVTIRLSETPLSIRAPMPRVGEHTDEILAEWLGYDAERIARLRSHSVI